MRHIPTRAITPVCLRTFVVAVILMVGLTAGTSQAIAQSLDAARASGMIGERFDGFTVARRGANPAARKMVTKVNNQRRKIYAKRAREQKIKPAQVGKFYARQIAAKAPKGTWILSQSGAWKRK